MLATTDPRPSRNSVRRQYLKMLQFIAAMADPTNAQETINKLIQADPSLVTLLKQPLIKKPQLKFTN